MSYALTDQEFGARLAKFNQEESAAGRGQTWVKAPATRTVSPANNDGGMSPAAAQSRPKINDLSRTAITGHIEARRGSIVQSAASSGTNGISRRSQNGCAGRPIGGSRRGSMLTSSNSTRA